jgi:hypothetical protein
MFCRSLFVLFRLTIVLYVFQLTVSDYTFVIFIVFLSLISFFENKNNIKILVIFMMEWFGNWCKILTLHLERKLKQRWSAIPQNIYKNNHLEVAFSSKYKQFARLYTAFHKLFDRPKCLCLWHVKWRIGLVRQSFYVLRLLCIHICEGLLHFD